MSTSASLLISLAARPLTTTLLVGTVLCSRQNQSRVEQPPSWAIPRLFTQTHNCALSATIPVRQTINLNTPVYQMLLIIVRSKARSGARTITDVYRKPIIQICAILG